MADLLTGRAKGVVEHFVQSRSGSLLVANGLEPVYRWDGLATAMVSAGVVAPTYAPQISASGVGKLLGPYYAYQRFQDRFGNWSDLSPITASTDGVAAPYAMGTIANVTNATPMVMTTAEPHNLTTGLLVRIFGVTGNTNANADYYVNVLSSTTFSVYTDAGLTTPAPGNGAYTGGGQYGFGKITGATNASPIEITFQDNHGMTVGSVVRISGVEGNTAANGVWQISTVPTVKKITLYASIGNGTFSTGGAGLGTGIGGSAISGSYHAFGQVVAASNTTPIYITTDLDHGMPTGSKVRIEGVIGNEAANGDWTIRRYDSTHFWLEDSAGSGTHTAGYGIWLRGGGTISYNAVQVSTESKVVRRQIMRNTAGQTRVFYVDVDTTDLASTSFTSTKDDETLAAQEAVSIADTMTKFALPPNNKPFLADVGDRIFAAGSIDYTIGHCKVTNGSATVYGIGTAWTSSMASRVLYVQGATVYYTISSVDVAAQTLTLSEVYAGSTDKFALYAIRSSVGDRKTIYWSRAGVSEAFDVTNGVAVAEDGDEITGLMPFNSFLYIIENRNLYKFTSGDDPANDGAMYHQLNRGCINNRCWVMVDDFAYMLAQNGIYRYSGDRVSESISDPIKNLFWPKGDLRILWEYKDLFSASLDRQRSIIRWFVSLTGSPPRWAIAYNYQLNRFWIEEYKQPILSAVTATFNSDRVQLAGSHHRKVMALWRQNGDVVDPATPTFTYRGTATSATNFTLTDTAAVFDTTNAVNAPLFIVDGKGKGQVRQVISLTATVLTINRPWSIKPDSTSVYQLGGICWNARGKWLKLTRTEEDQQRRLELVYQPTEDDADLRFRFRTNFSETPDNAAIDVSSDEGEGIRVQAGDPDYVVDPTKASGVVQQSLHSTREGGTDGLRYLQYELAGVTNSEPFRIYEITVDGFNIRGGG